jgi:tetrapyrrole methylase family protein/MazG family protein
MAITILGLGPGDSSQITREAWTVLNSSTSLYFRTVQHPIIADLPSHTEIQSFDHLYETVDDFEDLYQTIASKIVEEGLSGEHVTYAVPGHPLVGESTVTAIIKAAKANNLEIRILPGLSFVEPILSAIRFDALEGLQIFDAIQIAEYIQPPLNTDIALLLGQVYNRFVAGEVKIALMALYPEEHNVVLVHGAGTAGQQLEELPLHKIDRSEQISHLTTLYVPPVDESGSLQAFAETVAYLRSPDGCPWDQEQTRQSLREDFLEEVSEALEAIDDDNPDAIQEELGDVLYHIVMQAQIASELEEFTLRDIITGINSKLIRRHPHIWGDFVVNDTSDVLRNWEKLKEEEKTQKGISSTLLDNVPSSLPALARAQMIQSRVQKVGFDWPSIDGVIAKLDEELAELHEAGSDERLSEELGDVFFALVNWARWLGIHAESSLREANSRFEHRFRTMENMAGRRGLELADMELSDLDQLWEEAKTLVIKQSTPGASVL